MIFNKLNNMIIIPRSFGILPYPFIFNHKALFNYFILLVISYKGYGFVDEYVKFILRYTFYHNKISDISSIIFKSLIKIPYFKNKLITKLSQIENKIIDDSLELQSLVKHRTITLPVISVSSDLILNKMSENINADLSCQNPLKLSGAKYNTPGDEEKEMMKSVFDLYYKTNPLHSDIYPSLITMEKDIIFMVKNMLNCSISEGFGSLTTGGTESIILALFSYREYAKKYKGITSPEVVALSTVHPAFDKGCYYLGIKLRKVNVDESNFIDTIHLNLSINHNTILLVGSVPSFPHGLIDDIEILNHLACLYSIPIHIDACLGGFMYPFIAESPPFDFRVPCVQSISIDTHKYGCCPKGSSVLLFRKKEYMETCYFIQSEWSGGIYATTNITGSRSGLNVAWTWDMLNYQGISKLQDQANNIFKKLNRIKKAFSDSKDIFIYGDPIVCVVGFGSKNLNIYTISQKMKMLGWNLNELQNPSSFHFCITNCHTDDIITEFIENLKECINETYDETYNFDCIFNELISDEENNTANPNSNNANRNTNTNYSASIYGTTQKVPDKSIIDRVVTFYLNTLH